MNTQRTSAFLMANLGAEVLRILSAKDHNNELQIRECFERASKILKQIMTLPDMKTRKVEMNALSLLLHDMTIPNPTIHVSRNNISSYFTHFAMRVMNLNN